MTREEKINKLRQFVETASPGEIKALLCIAEQFEAEQNTTITSKA